MIPAPKPSETEAAELRRQMHAVNNELSVAILELELLLEDGALDPISRSAVMEALRACRRAAEQQRLAWKSLEHRAARP
jgi:hypothetical protein